MKVKNNKNYISVVIPTLNEENNISKVISGVKESLKGHKFEIIVVDGHSSDNTVKIAKKTGARILYENIGKGHALRIGFASSKGNIIISMDADMSHKPDELALLISGIETGYDICMGSRFISGGGSDDMPPFRKFGNKIFVLLVNKLYGAHYTDLCYGYRSFTREAAKKLDLISDGFGIETEISVKARKKNLKTIEVPSFEKKRNSGTGKLLAFRDGYTILKVILGNLS